MYKILTQVKGKLEEITENDQIKQIKIHQKYIESCIKGELLHKPNKENISNPKISIIISVYNKEKYILRILRSIQNQNFEIQK